MDILISSNIERLLFSNFSDLRTNELMNLLKTEKYFKLEKEELGKAYKRILKLIFCTDEECMKFIKESKILIDPHTATCFKMLDTSKAKYYYFNSRMD